MEITIPTRGVINEHKAIFSANQPVELKDTELSNFISIRGTGAPFSDEFQEKAHVLHDVAHWLTLMERANGHNMTILGLESLWSYDKHRYNGLSLSQALLNVPRESWYWQLLIRIPNTIKDEAVQEASEMVFFQQGGTLAKEVTSFMMKEGLVVEILHVGAYGKGKESVKRLEEFMVQEGLWPVGFYHELYLSDKGTTSAREQRTILRQPVERNRWLT